MSRFFVEKNNIYGDNTGDKIIITGDDYNHIKTVLRCKVGETLILCDGEKNDFTVRIDAFEANRIITTILHKQENNTEPLASVTLFQSIAKGEKMDFIIQKCVELGVKSIVPVVTERTVVRLGDGKDKIKKRERWQRIALEAAKQCNRGIIPQVELPLMFSEVIEKANKFHLSMIPYEREKDFTLRYVLADFKKKMLGYKKAEIAIFIGPEGGFSEKEVEAGTKAGLIPITLGPRVLRTETAALAVLSIIMYELEAMEFAE
ncbi:MAG TPA: 16S rRNA (uracil(1498)-N(3))-methyltransferase [Clostridiaceae bacterium]|nr:16S rRNA (uracil(1498)-N(3))-methyltransferase [Clostridiaceae bacterium]